MPRRLPKMFAQARGDLRSQGDFGQEVKHLLFLAQKVVDEVDVYFGFAAGCYAMQQCCVEAVERAVDGLQCFLLDGRQTIDIYRLLL